MKFGKSLALAALVLALAASPALATNKFWVGGTGSWDNTTTHWSLTSGGASGAAIPSSTDDVFINASSGGGTITIAAGNTGAKSISFAGSPAVTLAGSTAISVSGSVTLTSNVTLTYTGALSLLASGTLTSAGKTWPGSITINGAGITVVAADTLTITGASGLTLTQGTLDLATNGIDLTSTIFSSNNANTRSLSLAAAHGVVTLTGSGTIWTTATATNFTAPNLATIASTSTSGITVTTGTFTIPAVTTVAAAVGDTFTGNFTTVSEAQGRNFSNGANTTITTLNIAAAASPLTGNIHSLGVATGTTITTVNLGAGNRVNFNTGGAGACTITTLNVGNYSLISVAGNGTISNINTASVTNGWTMISSVAATQRTVTIGSSQAVRFADMNSIAISGGTLTNTGGVDGGNNSGVTFITGSFNQITRQGLRLGF